MYKDKHDPRLLASRRKHYIGNKEQYLKNNKLKKERMRTFLNELKDVPCMDCKKKFPPFCMDFDHRDMEEKEFSIGDVVALQSWDKLKKEVKKCDVVCAICHRIRTAKQLGWNGLRSGNMSASKTD